MLLEYNSEFFMDWEDISGLVLPGSLKFFLKVLFIPLNLSLSSSLSLPPPPGFIAFLGQLYSQLLLEILRILRSLDS